MGGKKRTGSRPSALWWTWPAGQRATSTWVWAPVSLTPSQYSIALYTPITLTTTPHTVWHLNPANRIISPTGQFSRMENRLDLLHQIAVKLFWHHHYFLTPFSIPHLFLLSKHLSLIHTNKRIPQVHTTAEQLSHQSTCTVLSMCSGSSNRWWVSKPTCFQLKPNSFCTCFPLNNLKTSITCLF